MKIISTGEARKRFAEITDEVRLDKVSYSVRRHGKEVVRIVPSAEDQVRISPNLKKELGDFFDRYDEALKTLAER